MKHNRFATKVAALAAASALLVGCSSNTSNDGGASAGTSSATGSSGSSAETAWERVERTGEIRVGLEGVFPPYSFHDDSGKLVGIEVEIAELIAKDLGVKPVFVETKWDSLIAGVDVDKFDIVINNLHPTEERLKKYDFSTQYARAVTRAAVAEDSDIQTPADLKGKRSAQTPTSNYATQAKDLGAEVVPTGGFAESIELVTSGRADATLNDVISFTLYFEQHPDAGVRLLDEEIPTEDGCCSILFEKGDDELKNKLDASIKKLVDDGTVVEISNRYVGIDISPEC